MLRRCSYDVAFKLNVVECAAKKSKEAAAREFEVAMKSIHLRCSQKDKLVALKQEQKVSDRETERSRAKTGDQNMEEVLFSWIVGLRSRNLRVFHSMIRVQTRALSTADSFKDGSADFRRDTLFPFDKKQLSVRVYHLTVSRR